MRYAQSHLSELLIYSGVVSLLGSGTWSLEQPRDSPEAVPYFGGLTLEMPSDSEKTQRMHPSEDELRKSSEYAVDFPG